MLQWYIEFRRALRDIALKSMDALTRYEQGGKEAAQSINDYLRADYRQLQELWSQQFADDLPSSLGRHIGWGMDNDYRDILKRDLFDLEVEAEKRALELAGDRGQLGFEHLLHPIIEKNCLEQYRNGHYREAVLNSVIALFDYIRVLTAIQGDGDALIGKAFSLSDPYIVFSDIQTESGQNDQKGFMQILKGTFQGIRNPKAHSLTHDLTEFKSAQYLIFASLLARRLEEAKVIKREE